MGEIVPPSVPSPEGDKNPFYLGKQCPYVGASAPRPAQAQLCATTNRHTRLWGHRQWHPLPVGDPHWLPRQARERQDGPPALRPRARHMAAPAQQAQHRLPSVGRGSAAGGSASLHGLSQQWPGRGEEGTSIIQTQKRRVGGKWSAGARSPTMGQGGVDTGVAQLDV